MAARVAHNHEVPGSSPGPATKKQQQIESDLTARLFFFASTVF